MRPGPAATTVEDAARAGRSKYRTWHTGQPSSRTCRRSTRATPSASSCSGWLGMLNRLQPQLMMPRRRSSGQVGACGGARSCMRAQGRGRAYHLYVLPSHASWAAKGCVCACVSVVWLGLGARRELEGAARGSKVSGGGRGCFEQGLGAGDRHWPVRAHIHSHPACSCPGLLHPTCPKAISHNPGTATRTGPRSSCHTQAACRLATRGCPPDQSAWAAPDVCSPGRVQPQPGHAQHPRICTS